jgi:hypothetical protein
MYEIRHEYFLMLLQMCFYFCTAAIALYFSAKHNAEKIQSGPSAEVLVAQLKRSKLININN